MRLGLVVAQDYWHHFHEIADAIGDGHQTSVFTVSEWPFQLMSSRANRYLLRRELERFLASNDIVLFEWAEEYCVKASELEIGAPIIIRMHSHELWDFAPRINWSSISQVILVSRAMERRLLERYPELTGRTVVIHNGVRLDKFTYSPHPFKGTIGTLSRVEPHKRIDSLVVALHQLLQQGHDLSLRIGGSTNETRYQRYADELALLVRRLDLESNVIFDGQVTDTPEWFKQIDIFVSNSFSEGLQVALLEAMASGCQCLSFAWDGVEEMLPLNNIYLSEAELMDKIREYAQLSNEEKAQQTQALRCIVEDRFNIDDRKHDVCQVVEDVARRHGIVQ